MRYTGARAMRDVPPAPVRVMAHPMRLVRAMNRMMFVWTRIGVG
jgi:hypothetical protein